MYVSEATCHVTSIMIWRQLQGVHNAAYNLQELMTGSMQVYRDRTSLCRTSGSLPAKASGEFNFESATDTTCPAEVRIL